MRTTVTLIANERAGALLGGGLAALEGALAGFEMVPVPAGPLAERVAWARHGAADLVVVAGGDGSVACAAEALAGSGRTLGLIPAGTMNLLARDLGIPAGDVAASVEILRTGVRRDIDVGEVSGSHSETHFFLCALMFGSPARLGRHREMGRRRGNGFFGWLHFGRAFVRALRRHRALQLIVTVDGIHHKMRTPSLTLTVNALDDSTTRMFGRSRLDGGMLCLYVVRHRSAAAFVRLLFNALRGKITGDPAVAVLHGREVKIDAPAGSLRVLVDGEERLLATPLQARILPGKLRVIAPA